MDWKKLAETLFPLGHSIVEQNDFLSGSAQVGDQMVSVIGTTGHTPIGVEIALAQARAILHTVREFPGKPIVMLIDTQGQRARDLMKLLYAPFNRNHERVYWMDVRSAEFTKYAANAMLATPSRP